MDGAAAGDLRATFAGSSSQLLRALPPEAVEAYVAHRDRASARHPLYETSSRDYGKVPRGVEAALKPPAFAKRGGFSSLFPGGGASKGGNVRSTLDTSVAKNKYLSALDAM